MATDEASVHIIKGLPFASPGDLAHVLAGAMRMDVGPLVRGLAGSGDGADRELLMETLVHFAIVGDVEREPLPAPSSAPAEAGLGGVRVDQMLEVQHLMASLLARYKALQRDFEQLSCACVVKDQRIAALEGQVQTLKDEKRALKQQQAATTTPSRHPRLRSSRSPQRDNAPSEAQPAAAARTPTPARSHGARSQRSTTPTRAGGGGVRERASRQRSKSKSTTPQSAEKTSPVQEAARKDGEEKDTASPKPNGKGVRETSLRERALLESVSLLHQDSDVCSQDQWMFRHGEHAAGPVASSASVSPHRHHSRSPAFLPKAAASPPPQFAHASNQRNRGGYQHVLYPAKRLAFTPPKANAAGLIATATRSPSRSTPPRNHRQPVIP
eukprot:TRINITY_DN25161_c0_g1_i1.p1 TRINITY_DN25161_c0_g1~~TRINITY_DN25161_c0_g1_i1.p1  ORF type:complete len:384 (+),score=113.95 TRINITY_DN25161_c0_g1_i1:109-1260(+)